MPTETNTKKCPFCAELIKVEAIKCRFCGEFLDADARTDKRIDIGDEAYVESSVTTDKNFVGYAKSLGAAQVSNSSIDQRGQHVNNQYNAMRDINFAVAPYQVDVVTTLKKLQGELVKAIEAKVIDPDVATDVHYNLEKAIQKVRKPEPDKTTIVDYLNQAKTLILEVAAMARVATELTQVIELIRLGMSQSEKRYMDFQTISTWDKKKTFVEA